MSSFSDLYHQTLVSISTMQCVSWVRGRKLILGHIRTHTYTIVSGCGHGKDDYQSIILIAAPATAGTTTGIAVGIVLGVLVLITIIVVVIVIVVLRVRRNKEDKDHTASGYIQPWFL